MESFIGSRRVGPEGPDDADRGSNGSSTEAGSAVSPEGVGGAVPGAGAQRVLVVDDNAHSADSLAMILNLWGHETRVAYNGRRALEIAREYRPDVILLDIGLPGMDGYAVARELRSDPVCRNATILAMTGYGREQDRRDALAAGFDSHLLKPLELGALEVFLAELAATPR